MSFDTHVSVKKIRIIFEMEKFNTQSNSVLK